MFFEKKGPVWETLRGLKERLREAGIDYVVIGGLAVNAYNYPRQTVDVEIVVTAAGYEKFRSTFVGSAYAKVPDAPRRFIDATTEVPVDLLISGELAGKRSKNPSIRFPDPSQPEIHEGLRTISLARLIELKLVTWRFKDWGDVVELIRRNDLPGSFADGLDAVVRHAYGECFDQATDEHYESSGDEG